MHVIESAYDPGLSVKRILFVDDERYLLDGLRDALRPYRRHWAMSFVTNGDEALSRLAFEQHDIVVSDLRMPGMDGATLLARVRDVHPSTVRIVLSGQAELRMVARAAGVAHRLLAKPCEIGELARVIERSCALQDITERVELGRRAAGATSLPSVPRLYLELTELLHCGETGAEDAARIVESDPGMAAKVLQLANSAFFGRRNPVSGVREAVVYLGLEALRALALSAEAFQRFPIDPPIPGFDVDGLQRHCTRVARLAHAICGEEWDAEEAFTAGLLHDVGLLVLAVDDRTALIDALRRARTAVRPLHEVERERFGVTHAEVGAHLLALWGLPHPVTEAVARHHEPPKGDAPFDSVAVTYIATALIEELEANLRPWALPVDGLDSDYLEAARVTARVPGWLELASRQVGEDLR
ncbi:MAG TPA: response regulator [Solirubrobacteraceae bacterium]|nr:response regulator [Solirubrobacteraceae bacterium]